MKQIFTSLLFLIIADSAFSQVVTQSINLVVPCCANLDSIDIGNDGQHDIQVRSNFFFDSADIRDSGLYSQVKVTSIADSGTAFQPIDFNPYGGTLAQTTILCDWNSVWYPNTGKRYSGFKIANAPNDTTFGWVRFDFRGDATSCADTMYADLLAYCTQSNVHLNAGQTSLTGIQENKFGELFQVFYDQKDQSIHLSNKSLQMVKADLINLSGSKLKTVQLSSQEKLRIDLSNLPPGVYFIQIAEEGYSARFVKR